MHFREREHTSAMTVLIGSSALKAMANKLGLLALSIWARGR
jgi:hypothetical protein